LLFAAALHPMWILLYPFFHSLQYLLFVYAYKRGERASGSARGIWSWFAASLLGGAMFFALLPMSLEQWLNPGMSLFLPVTAAFVIFINIHHYFIDNVIWRKEHTEMTQYLFHSHHTGRAHP
jgi:phosphatidylglycerophosphate synthase